MKQKKMYIERQAPITLRQKDGTRVETIPPLSHDDWADQVPLNDKRFDPSQGFASIMAGGRIQSSFRCESEEIVLEEDDYKILVDVLENPNPVKGPTMSPEMARQYRPFMTSIMDASNKPGKKPKKKPKKNSKNKSKATSAKPEVLADS